jgi:hypothetical protein
MGLDAKFKDFLRESFPSAVLPCPPDDEPPAVLIIDAMCILHQYSPYENDEGSLQALGNYVWNNATASAGGSTTVVVCFDDQNDLPRQKELEYAKRPRPDNAQDPEELERMLLSGRTPAPWKSVVSDRDARGAIVRALRDALGAKFSERAFPQFKKLIVHGAGRRATVWSAAPDGNSGIKIARSEKSGNAELLGEGDISMIYWLNRLRLREPSGVAVIRTIDSDIIALALLHASPETYVALSHYDARERRPVHCVVDVWALAEEIPRKYKGATPELFVLAAIARKTDFVARLRPERDGKPTGGLPAWPVWMTSCLTSLVTLSSPLEMSSASIRKMLKTVPIRGGGTILASAAHARRIRWNYTYWLTAPRGEACLVGLDPFSNGWAFEADGETLRAM